MKNSPQYAAKRHRKELRRRAIAPVHQFVDGLIDRLKHGSKEDKARAAKLLQLRTEEKQANYRKHHTPKVRTA